MLYCYLIKLFGNIVSLFPYRTFFFQTEIADRYGCVLTTHKVTTEDGYILSMYRLSKKDTTNSTDTNLTPVMIQHGILVDGLSWMISGEHSLSKTW